MLRGESSERKIDRSTDRKSTRLNSSHGYISYAVFCLKKKKHPPADPSTPPPAEAYDLVIHHGLVIDGSGNPAFATNIAIHEGRITCLIHSTAHTAPP